GSFTDPRDGQIYSVVLIGDQVWMAENLKSTVFNDGTEIPLITDNTEWAALTTPAFCWYKNDYDTYGTTYGALYNWYTVNTGKLCPTGWHVPSDSEWTNLADYLGGTSVAGGKLKETGTSHWLSPNKEATNAFGFTALPGGLRGVYDGGFYQSTMVGFWWSSMEYSSIYAWNFYMQTYNTMLVENFIEKGDGLSVRCLRD
ncbi:MAG TPA: fibrobacter succinogenes major paralogous domain-containing protein, partial [Prolixibacteraceae bacterium]|nr:fibrobacter succinogenes major paralogous domain-containing protein [Prolixibacteraceae bacterium]